MGRLNVLGENVVSPSCVGAVVGATVGGTTVGAGGVAAGAQAENNTITSINTKASNLRVFIFFPNLRCNIEPLDEISIVILQPDRAKTNCQVDDSARVSYISRINLVGGDVQPVDLT